MRYTSICQAVDGLPEVKIEAIQINKTTAAVEYRNGQSASNYISRYMVDEGLIPADFAERAFDGWLKIRCLSRAEAIDISARIDATITAKLTEARKARTERVMEYIGAIIATGKKIYTRGDKGRFCEII
jgi:hypothetical protein